MSRLPFFRRLLKCFHPEGIPGLGARIYNKISSTSLFQANYDLLTEDILDYCCQGRILDIGTGPAWLLIKLHNKSPGLSLSGIDVSSSMVVEARKNIAAVGLSQCVHIVEADARQLPFPDGGFNAVVSTGSIHHWKDPVAALNEVYRVLSPGGWALIYDIVADTPSQVYAQAERDFGRLRTMLFWLHTYEEPFYKERDFLYFANQSLFREGSTRYVGALCCLTMTKGDGGKPPEN